MLVKDQLTGERKPREELYKVVTEKIDRNGLLKKTTKYYTSKNAYEEWKNNQEYRQKCIDYMYEVLSYETFQKLPGVFFHKLSEWEPYSYEVVYRCMMNSRDAVERSMYNKEFYNENGKVLYICAIYQNNLNDALKEIKREKFGQKDFNPVESIDLDIQNKKQKTKDISKFLEEDD